MQSKIIIGLTLIISILLVEVSFPKKNRIISNEANLKKVEKQKLTQSKKIDSPITKASNRPVENQTIIQITTLTDTKKNAGTDSKVGAFINGDKKKYLRLDSPSLNDYKNGQVIIGSDRLVFDARKDELVLISKKDVKIATPNWQTDMNEFFTQIEAFINICVEQAQGAKPYATPTGPTGPSSALPELQKIQAALKQMKQ